MLLYNRDYTYDFLDPGSSQKDEGNTTEKSGIDRRSQKISDSNKKDEGTGEKPNDVTGKKTDPKLNLYFDLRKETNFKIRYHCS